MLKAFLEQNLLISNESNKLTVALSKTVMQNADRKHTKHSTGGIR